MHNSFRRCTYSHFSRLFAQEHIPLNVIERASLFFSSSFSAFRDPTKGHLVACLGEMLSNKSLSSMYDEMRNDAVGRQILLSKPLIDDNHIDFKALESLPDNTVGKAYITFMKTFKFHAAEREPVHFVENEELAYVMTRYRQLHDFSHILFGLNTSVECEVALKAIEMIQTKLPMCVLATLFGPLTTPILRIKTNETNKNCFVKHKSKINDAIHYDYYSNKQNIEEDSSLSLSLNSFLFHPSSKYDNTASYPNFYRYVLYPRRILLNQLLPWAIKTAGQCKKPMHLIHVEQWLDKPIDDLRKFSGISIPPEHLRCYTSIEYQKTFH